MILENIEKLEKLIGSLVEETQRLRAENEALSGDKQSLEQQLAVSKEKIEGLEAKIRCLDQLEKTAKKYEAEQDVIRTKVQNILRQLDKIDLG